MRTGLLRLTCVRAVGVAATLVLLSACAARTAAPPSVTAPRFPDFVYPTVPSEDAQLEPAQKSAWQWLQAGNPRMAERQFSRVLKDRPDFAPAETGLGYVALARGDHADALRRFDRALQHASTYASALVGRAQALVAAGRDAEALAAYEAAAAADPSLDLGARIAVLQFRGTGDAVTRARAAADKGALDEARTAYQQAIDASPESAFLYRELGVVEARSGNREHALELYRKASTLDPSDARAHVLAGDMLVAMNRFDQAAGEYSAALAIESTPEVQAKLDAARERGELARLPAEYTAIAAKPEVTRADVAAVLGVHLGPWLSSGRGGAGVLLTDIRSSWAASWILAVVRAGLMESFPNHTFQPALPVRRSDLAQIVNRALALIASRQPTSGASWTNARQALPDVPPSHPLWPAISRALSSGVLQTDPDGSFAPNRSVSGAELTAAAERLRQLFGPAPRR